MKLIALIFYYAFLRYLPATDNAFLIFTFIRKLRSSIGKLIFDSCGKNINIEAGANFGTGKGISIGNNSGIGINSRIHGPLSIGNDVMMGPDVVILTSNHKFRDVEIPMRMQGNCSPKKVTIEDDVWIGTKVIILPGITIGRGAVIGAGSILVKDIPAFAIAAGNPARVIRYRK